MRFYLPFVMFLARLAAFSSVFVFTVIISSGCNQSQSTLEQKVRNAVDGSPVVSIQPQDTPPVANAEDKFPDDFKMPYIDIDSEPDFNAPEFTPDPGLSSVDWTTATELIAKFRGIK